METKLYSRPRATKVRLVASLPDMGQVGSLVTDFLVDHLKVRPFAEIVSFDRPFVLCKNGLVSEVPSVYRFYFSEKAKLIVMNGDNQPQETGAMYALAEEVLNLSQGVGRLERVYSCGGYHRDEIRGEAKVYGVANSLDLFKELDRLGIREIDREVSSITWFNGVILGVAKRRRIGAIGLYGELTNPDVPQPQAAKAVLKALTTLLSIPKIKATNKTSCVEEKEKQELI